MEAVLVFRTAPVAEARPSSTYRARLACSATDVRAAQALRFEVFNLELDEGLVQSYDTGLDEDPFDAVCDHLLVEDERDGSIVGTYRLQTGRRAQQGLGYYSAREFDLSPFESARGQILELGRACIHRRHRSFAVLNLLWRAIAAYAQAQGVRYLLGCSSLPSCEPADGLAVWGALRGQVAPERWRTEPLPGWQCEAARASDPVPPTPRLLAAYLALGARICGAPALDREFRTVDFLTWLDVQAPEMQAWQRRGARRS